MRSLVSESDYVDSLSALWHVAVLCTVENRKFGFVSVLLEILFDHHECPSLIVRLEVLYVFQKYRTRFFIADDFYDIKEEIATTFVVEASFESCDREWLAWKAGK